MNYVKLLEDVNFFIEDIEGLPPNSMCTGELMNAKGQRCFNGLYIDMKTLRPSIENAKLVPLFNLLTLHYIDFPSVEVPKDTQDYSTRAVVVNNGGSLEYPRYKYPTVEGRNLAALYDIKELIETYMILNSLSETEEHMIYNNLELV